MTTNAIYLCQHGDALATEVDPDRPLSERGSSDIQAMAALLKGKVEIQTIVHSGKTRARQTAELFGEKLAPKAEIRMETGLNPKDPAATYAQKLATGTTDIMVVSHLPFVGKLACHLMTEQDGDILAFEPGAVAALKRDAGGNWLLEWMLTPALLSGRAGANGDRIANSSKQEATMTEKSEFLKQLDAQIKNWTTEIKKMEAEADKVKADAKIQYEEGLKKMREQRDEAQKKLKDFQQASDAAWDDMRKGAEDTWSAMETSFRNAMSRFK